MFYESNRTFKKTVKAKSGFFIWLQQSGDFISQSRSCHSVELERDPKGLDEDRDTYKSCLCAGTNPPYDGADDVDN